ncbi:uncharacterized protein LOC117780285 [Drosophila innubila]|uniref:uncharacterized protein LOC117780285 n=1 Tax=Drosophila innubila TaxID=198719 RepID=UPI00148D93E2|nr:uncharacterized protein LOC117780285 [Drosophila innubila]
MAQRRHPYLIDKVIEIKKDKKEKVAAANIAKRRRKLSFDDDKSQEPDGEEFDYVLNLDNASITELQDGLHLIQEGNEKNLVRLGIQILHQQIQICYSKLFRNPISYRIISNRNTNIVSFS